MQKIKGQYTPKKTILNDDLDMLMTFEEERTLNEPRFGEKN